MFYLKRRGSGDTKSNESSNEDDFGWWLNDPDFSKSFGCNQGKDCRSSASSSSMLSCIDSDENVDNYSLVEEFKQESYDSGEKIELTSLTQEDLDLDLIEKDASMEKEEVTFFATQKGRNVSHKADSKGQRTQAICYTPERLVRSQEYRILTPSPRYLSSPQTRVTLENENPRKARRCRRRLSYLIDSKQVGATQLKALLDLNAPEILAPAVSPYAWQTYQRVGGENISIETSEKGTVEDQLNLTDRRRMFVLDTPDSIGRRSSYEKLNVTWEDCKRVTTRSSSLEDTSGIQSNDWSSETHSDLQNTPLCLCDELPVTSTDCRHDFSQERGSVINGMVSILLETEPNKASILLDEDRFCDSTSSHDQLTRLALAIESDGNVPGVREDPEKLVRHLKRKVEKLQIASKDIYRDICNLRRNFQSDEKRMADISLGATKLRQDVHEMRYLDDLLNLLRGELERISRRNWPFVLGHTEHHSEEMNLIV